MPARTTGAGSSAGTGGGQAILSAAAAAAAAHQAFFQGPAQQTQQTQQQQQSQNQSLPGKNSNLPLLPRTAFNECKSIRPQVGFIVIHFIYEYISFGLDLMLCNSLCI